MSQEDTFKTRARVGFAKGEEYDQYRPTYSPTIVQLLLDNLQVNGKQHAKILDLAAGTGKFTEAVAAREEQFEIVAVEPHEKMRGVLAGKELRGVTVKDGKADAIPLPDASVDAVICAQAFHWFATKPALQEIHRVLKRHGHLGMVWNIEDYNAPQGHKAKTTWEAKAHDLIWSFNDEDPRFRHEKWREVFDEQVKSSPLSLLPSGDDEQFFSLPLGEQQEAFETWLPKEKIWDRFNTLSHIAVLEGEEREKTYKTFMEALNSPDTETDGEGRVAVHGTTFAVWTSKIPAEGRDELADVERQ
ncbi:S-adenosyl-L-methionine-dependent methyltransferase [Neohortaea acidophila]|uniref:S-adenosyl-L-methionine-dependent methyltransferase n=1 Tax=Neohortaea acidophila TaxID=245834 RepID=A0A6A6PME5_9PEZI|nr:S-adenosyl-L-methionine-dependent methyltransferase [Neohortaea acidophila]KAF2481085.1 S-adenosyl-L-methionine-dependent methyltransferase [Neohortaea acidophila]